MYCVQESTRTPLSASGLPNAFLKSKVRRQNSSKPSCAPGLGVLDWVDITSLLGQTIFACFSRAKSSRLKPSSRRYTSWLS